MAELTRDSRDAGPRQRAFGLRVPRGSPDAEFVPEAAPLDDEIVLDRSGAALFPTTNVERLLRNLGTRTVLIAGTSIDGGIEATIRNAADRDWDVVLLSDASALFWQPDGLEKMAGGLTTVMTVAELGETSPPAPSRRGEGEHSRPLSPGEEAGGEVSDAAPDAAPDALPADPGLPAPGRSRRAAGAGLPAVHGGPDGRAGADGRGARHRAGA